MTRHVARGRSGITLTEVLISILIMGIGIISLATLFPLGLLRMREATRLSRSAYLTESAGSDLNARNLLSKRSFLDLSISPWYSNVNGTFTPWPYDPWIQDTPTPPPAPASDPIVAPYGVYRGTGSFNQNNPNPHDVWPPPFGIKTGPGLPVAYDPLWRAQTGYYPGSAAFEARFASGLGFIRPDPNPGAAPDPSAHGLQRITNFFPNTAIPNPVLDIFVSPEDVVLQSQPDATGGAGALSPLVPDLTQETNARTGLPTPQNDWRYTWMFTGSQADANGGTVFTGDIVVFENRPFGVEQPAVAFITNVPNAGTPYFAHSLPVPVVVAGETVVEAIFGYSKAMRPSAGTRSYGAATNRNVLLRWSDKMPDPEVKVGSWIADVTYERNATEDQKRAVADAVGVDVAYPYQRCHWYQVVKRTPAAPGESFPNEPGTYREMTVWVNSPLRAFTLLDNTGIPYHVNAALISPYVVNVFPKTIFSR